MFLTSHQLRSHAFLNLGVILVRFGRFAVLEQKADHNKLPTNMRKFKIYY